MTPSEAVALTGYIQAHFPSQPINDYTPDALHELLAGYPMSDCRTAVLTISRRATGDRTQWCAPSDVAAEVRKARAKRIAQDADYNPPAGLDPDDTAAYARFLIRSREDAAAGRPLPEQTPASIRGREAVAALGPIGLDVDTGRSARQAIAEAKTAEAASDAAKRALREAKAARMATAREADRKARAGKSEEVA